MKHINNLFGRNIFNDKLLLGILVGATFLKIVGQIYYIYWVQVLLLILINLILIIPVIKLIHCENQQKIIYYLIVLFFGQCFIIFHENTFFLKLGIALYLAARIIMLTIFDSVRKRISLDSFYDFVKLFLPMAISFLLGYIFYNNAILDLSLSILVILFAVADALVFSLLLNLEKFPEKTLTVFGVVLLVMHDSLGGFNFFNKNIDPFYVISFVLITVGNYTFIKGLYTHYLTKA